MKLKITLSANKNIILPCEFNHIIQALIYNLLDRVSAEWLHEMGFKKNNRTFKLFTFSSILEKGNFNKNKKHFIFPREISFFLSSPVNWIIEQTAKNICIKEKIQLGENVLSISSVEIIKNVTVEKRKIRINALTPIETHSTLLKGDGTKKTYYYSPGEREFCNMINENLRRKWSALYKKECLYNIKIHPVNIKYCKERIRSFKGIIIKGWTGHFWMEGEPELLQFAMAAGIGSRNSGGFGFIEMVKNNRIKRNPTNTKKQCTT